MIKILSYNVNGIRAAMNKSFADWLDKQNAGIICLQEMKAMPDQFDPAIFENLGYHCYWHPAERKGYSGVAVLSKTKPLKVEIGCGEKIYDDEGRIIRADFPDFTQISVYIPSGSMGDHRQVFKMEFLAFFYDYIKKLKKEKPNLLISGDFNICHQAIDIHDPIRNAHVSGFLPEEREWVSNFLEMGFIDTYRYKNPGVVKYSWWSYRMRARERNVGWRLDYHMASLPLKDRIVEAEILNDVYHSDHCPVSIVLQ
jgi:exodeoxyribonuclease III